MTQSSQTLYRLHQKFIEPPSNVSAPLENSPCLKLGVFFFSYTISAASGAGRLLPLFEHQEFCLQFILIPSRHVQFQPLWNWNQISDGDKNLMLRVSGMPGLLSFRFLREGCCLQGGSVPTIMDTEAGPCYQSALCQTGAWAWKNRWLGISQF